MLPIYSLSNLFFLYIFNDELSVLPMIGLVIGIVHAALPMGEYNEILCKVILLYNNIDCWSIEQYINIIRSKR